ncbi:MAG: hypothetical protein ACXVSX_10885 [Solirubrobacteraceae bacterium]
MTPVLIHVRCDAAGTWFVHVDETPMPVSAHANETEAETAASEWAERIADDCYVVIHDRYARTHLAGDPVGASPVRRHQC